MTSDPAFVNERLPEEVEQGAKGGPTFFTTVLPLDSGFEKRNQNWSLQRLKWDIGYGIQTKSDYESVLSFFYVCQGRAHGFRFKDWSDFEIVDVATGNPQFLFTGDGTTNPIQAFRRYKSPSGDTTFDRKITRLVQNSTPPLAIYNNGVAWLEGTNFTVDYDTGIITPISTLTTGHTFTIYAQFDVPARFDSDTFQTDVTWADAMALTGINLIETKE